MNKNEFKSIVAKNGETLQQLATAMGLYASGISDRLNGKVPFRQNEIAFIRKRYHLSASEVDLIFFGEELS